MQQSAAILLALLLAILSARSAAADVQVTFVNSFRYSDLANMSPTKRDATLSEIRKTLTELGAHYLPPKTLLAIEILDMEPVVLLMQPTSPTGKANSADAQPVQLDLQYVLQQNGKITRRDHEAISDLNYLTNPPPQQANEHGEHKKHIDPKMLMLRDWFIKRFGALTSADH